MILSSPLFEKSYIEAKSQSEQAVKILNNTVIFLNHAFTKSEAMLLVNMTFTEKVAENFEKFKYDMLKYIFNKYYEKFKALNFYEDYQTLLNKGLIDNMLVDATDYINDTLQSNLNSLKFKPII